MVTVRTLEIQFLEHLLCSRIIVALASHLLLRDLHGLAMNEGSDEYTRC